MLMEAHSMGEWETLPKVVGGRYGLSSKEFTPSMVKGVCDELLKEHPKNHFTIGIHDDVTNTSLGWDPEYDLEKPNMTRALFFGLGSDGTVGANKNSIKIIGENTDLYAQGYFVYDSRKAGSQTVSHLRIGPYPIKAPYLIQTADFIACHQFGFIYKTEVLKNAGHSATFLLDSPYGPDEVWEHLPKMAQEIIQDRELKVYVIDASTVARNASMGRRINTVMQTCFFALSGVLPRDEAIAQIKKAIEKTYYRKGPAVIEQNFKAVDAALDHLYEVSIPASITSDRELDPVVTLDASEFVREVTAPMLEGKGDDLPVSRIPVDGTYPSGTTKWEKRNLADNVPYWEPDICIQCGNCSFVCPHGVIRSKFYHERLLDKAPGAFQSAKISARGFPETRYTLQIYLEDCTGCGVCIEACPAHSPDDKDIKAINMKARKPMLEEGQANVRYFEKLPMNNRGRVDFSSVRGTQFLEPLFEFSLACAGCGETPYVKLLSQLFGPRLLVANATGCSSIYGGNLPTTPWAINSEGRGPAWSNSLFEDNAEFGLGMRITADNHMDMAKELLQELSPWIGEEVVDEMVRSEQWVGE